MVLVVPSERKVMPLKVGRSSPRSYPSTYTLLPVFVCVAALAIMDRLDVIDHETLAWWLAERQLPNGGLNGRPEKLEDVCYSFWVLSALSILKRVPWIDADQLTRFILSAQVRTH